MKDIGCIKAKELINDKTTDIHTLLKSDALMTGFKDLDDITEGFFPGELICVAGRRCMGSTGLVLSILKNVCVRDKKSCLYFTFSEDGRGILTRLVANITRNLAIFRPEYENTLIKTVEEIKKSPLYINETAFFIETIEKACVKFTNKKHLDLVIIDEYHLIATKKQDRSLISARLKQLARKLKCPVLVICKLDNKLDLREDHRPVLSDLEDVGKMNHFADKVMFLYRESYYEMSIDYRNPAEIFIAKNSNGREVGEINLIYMPGGIFEETTEYKIVRPTIPKKGLN